MSCVNVGGVTVGEGIVYGDECDIHIGLAYLRQRGVNMSATRICVTNIGTTSVTSNFVGVHINVVVILLL